MDCCVPKDGEKGGSPVPWETTLGQDVGAEHWGALASGTAMESVPNSVRGGRGQGERAAPISGSRCLS